MFLKSTFFRNFLVFALTTASIGIVSGQEAIVIHKDSRVFTLSALHQALPVQFQTRLTISNHISTFKSNLVENIKIDTAVVQSVLNTPRRYSYLYNSSGNTARRNSEEYKNGAWSQLTTDTLTYDADGNPLSSTWKNWVSGQWQNASMKRNQYGAQNSLLNSVTKSWSNGSWVNVDTSYYTYNSNWKKVAYYKKVWNGTKWLNNSYEIYTYDANGRMLVTYRYVWQDSTWVNQQRYLFSYDQNGNVDSSMIQNGDRQQWINFYLETYTYDASKNRTSYLGKFWSTTKNDWENFEQYTYTYNSSGYRTSATGEKWESNAWVNSDKGQYFYDVYGGLESAQTQIWKNSAWADTTLAQYVFDQNGNATTGDYYVKNGNSWEQNSDGLLEVSYNYNLDIAYYTGYHVQASYPVATGIRNNWSDVSKFICGPNPVHNEANLIFDLDKTLNVQVDLYNLNGEVVLHIYNGLLEKGSHNYSIDMSGIPAGIYIATLKSGVHSKSLKLIHLH
ncbi:MAG: T9SS type A sorting domain-containing protein [Bacteroidales bacterium]|nr:T9SS type A sorting domain-containing protein [Bacteroidales bacterium]